MKKSQLVFVPYPGMGHIGSTTAFAKLLIKHNQHLSVTVLVIPPFDVSIDSFMKSMDTTSLSIPNCLSFIHLPPYPDPTNSQSLHRAAFIDSVIEYQKPNIRDALSKLNSDPDSPPLAGLVVDMFTPTMIDVAIDLKAPHFMFYASSAAFLGFVLHFHMLREQDSLDTTVINFKDSGLEFAIPFFENHVPASVFPRVMSEKEWALYFFRNAGRMKRLSGIIVNTFEELESQAIQSLCNDNLTVYPIGPMLNIGEDVKKTNIPEGSKEVMNWLDDQPPSSVLLLCFGSKGYFDDENQVREIARALVSSGVRFVWSLRRPPLKSLVSVESARDYSNQELEAVLPVGFLEQTAEIGRVMGWAPQAQILAHKAVGGFVSHCGWNSILESIYYGVPIATWPIYSEQQFNAFEMVRELKMSEEISLDYRIEYEESKKPRLINAERIEKGIKQVMQKESEVRKKVKEMSEMSKRALMEGGSSYSYLQRFIHDVLKCE
ncbi:hypothetical protein QN277_016068 [Acacia crassicarpa]|uniref:Glycosyltransferase n=1 Tax=Acacia crassicarpa TaxID=499986 RepID=A0AAE1MVU9_9FABA|nr:hypothetical protein QN277_016068 [Acacia crassicarpa]